MSRIDPPDTGTLDSTVEELFAQIADIHGFVPNQHHLEAHFPLLLRSLLDLNRRVLLAGELDPDLLEIIAFVLAVENECEYCQRYHSRLLEDRTISSEGIEQLRTNWRAYEFTQREQTIVEFAVTINASPHAVTDETIAELMRVGLSERALVQLVHFTSLMRGYHTFNIVFDTDEGDRDGHWMG